MLNSLKQKHQETTFLIFLSFLISFIVARVYVYFFIGFGTASDLFPMKNYFLHHLYYGIALLVLAGWLAINYKNKKIHRISSILYGIGLGLFLDEIGLLLTHFENYWDSITYTLIIITSLILINIILFKDFWDSIRKELKQYINKKQIKHGPFNILHIIDVLDMINEKMPNTKKITTFFTGLILITAGILTLNYPNLIYYWVSGAFILSGVSYLIQAIKG